MKVIMYPGPTPNDYLGLLAQGMGDEVEIEPLRLGLPPQTGDILHIHWPEFFFRQDSIRERLRIFLLKATIRLFKMRGGSVVWTVHNLAPHDAGDGPKWRRYDRFMEWFLKQVDVAIALNEMQMPQLRTAFPGIRKWSVVEHPSYTVDGRVKDRAALLRQLDIPCHARVTAALGHVRRYKNIPALIRAFLQAAGDTDYLIIGGRFRDDALRSEVTDAIGGDPRVRFLDGHLDDDLMISILAASELAVLNAPSSLNSGSIFLALSAGAKVLAPATPTVEDLRRRAGSGWAHLFEPPLTALAIRRALDTVPKAALPPPQLDEFAPATVGRSQLRAYAAARDR